MFSTITSAAISGINVILVHVEVDVSQGLPCLIMVGYLSSAVKEAGERVRIALKNSGISIPPMRITVNLAPADIRKEGTSFDLPIAIGLLQSLGHVKEDALRHTMVVGELSLDGKVNAIKGILPLVRKSKEMGMKRCLVPEENRAEGDVIDGIEVIGVTSLQEVLLYLKGERAVQKVGEKKEIKYSQGKDSLDFCEISGQTVAKRAVEIAAAGFHNLFLIGPPGSGKTMIAKRIPSILPPLTQEECLEVSTIYSISGLLNSKETLITKRPFMSPHHTVTAKALIGGGMIPKPGVISLAHKGVLFLDEMAEINNSTLDMLRQPLEEKKVNIARVGGNYTYPADFMLVGAVNPCPCGYYPDRSRCRCNHTAIAKYQSSISGPIMDRIDLCAEVPPIAMKELVNKVEGESSDSIRRRVLEARNRQKERYKGIGYDFNAGLTAKDIRKFCFMEESGRKLMERAFERFKLSARGYYRILRVARTIADLDGSGKIEEIHLAEALGYRVEGNQYWE